MEQKIPTQTENMAFWQGLELPQQLPGNLLFLSKPVQFYFVDKLTFYLKKELYQNGNIVQEQVGLNSISMNSYLTTLFRFFILVLFLLVLLKTKPYHSWITLILHMKYKLHHQEILSYHNLAFLWQNFQMWAFPYDFLPTTCCCSFP